MAEGLVLRLLTPEHELCDEPATQVTAEGALGQFGVLPDHTALLTALDPGMLRVRRPDGSELAFAVKGGYAEVRDNVVTVLAEDALPVERIDASVARADRERAAAAFDAAAFGQPEYERARHELRWAEVRMELARG